MGTQYFPTGTKTLFRQTVAPIGWTKDVTYNDYALRVVGTSPFSPGGSVNFTTAMTSYPITGTITLSTAPGGYPVSINSGDTVAPLPQHQHPASTRFFNTIVPVGPTVPVVPQGLNAFTNSGSPAPSNNNGGGNTHNHTITCNASFVGDTTNFSINYVDVIICSIN